MKFLNYVIGVTIAASFAVPAAAQSNDDCDGTTKVVEERLKETRRDKDVFSNSETETSSFSYSKTWSNCAKSLTNSKPEDIPVTPRTPSGREPYFNRDAAAAPPPVKPADKGWMETQSTNDAGQTVTIFTAPEPQAEPVVDPAELPACRIEKDPTNPFAYQPEAEDTGGRRSIIFGDTQCVDKDGNIKETGNKRWSLTR